jgi:hypothetical protein
MAEPMFSLGAMVGDMLAGGPRRRAEDEYVKQVNANAVAAGNWQDAVKKRAMNTALASMTAGALKPYFGEAAPLAAMAFQANGDVDVGKLQQLGQLGWLEAQRGRMSAMGLGGEAAAAVDPIRHNQLAAFQKGEQYQPTVELGGAFVPNGALFEDAVRQATPTPQTLASATKLEADDAGNLWQIGPGGQARAVQFGGESIPLPAPTAGSGSAVLQGALEDAVMHVESRGNPNAVSPKGALGTMQTMPNTLRDPGFGVRPARDNSPAEMERVGKDYLRAMQARYGLEGGLAAYNWGPGNWEAALERSGGDVRRALASAPAETRAYVPKVLDRLGDIPTQVAQAGGRPTFKGKGREGARYVPLSASEVNALGLPAGTVAQRNETTGQVSILSKPSARSGAGGSGDSLPAGEAGKVRTRHRELRETLDTFKAFDDALQDIPNGPGIALDGAAKGRLGTAYNNARAQLRVLYNTGVLQPGELPMLENALRDPTSYSALIDPRARSQLRSQLDELYRLTEKAFDSLVTSYPQMYDQERYRAEKNARRAPAPGTPGQGGTAPRRLKYNPATGRIE